MSSNSQQQKHYKYTWDSDSGTHSRADSTTAQHGSDRSGSSRAALSSPRSFDVATIVKNGFGTANGQLTVLAALMNHVANSMDPGQTCTVVNHRIRRNTLTYGEKNAGLLSSNTEAVYGHGDIRS